MNLLSLSIANPENQSDKKLIAAKHKGHTLFTNDLSFSKFASLVSQGAKVRTTTLSENFSFDDLLKQSKVYPLFAIDKMTAFMCSVMPEN